MNFEEIISKLPYESPFLFVDELTEVSENHIIGSYVLKQTEYFYQGHFKNLPVTPGVILTEIMAQIGVVCLGINLLKNEIESKPRIALTSNKVDFYLPVYPKEKVTVHSEKMYFRFGKLKCKVQLFNEKKELVCQGEIAGMIVNE